MKAILYLYLFFSVHQILLQLYMTGKVWAGQLWKYGTSVKCLLTQVPVIFLFILHMLCEVFLWDCHKLPVLISHMSCDQNINILPEAFISVCFIPTNFFFGVIKKHSRNILEMGYAWHAHWWYTKMPHTITL